MVDIAVSGGSYDGPGSIIRGYTASYPFSASISHFSGAYPVAEFTSGLAGNYEVYYLTTNVTVTNGTEARLSPDLTRGNLDLAGSRTGLEVAETKTLAIRTSINLGKEQCDEMVYLCILLLDHEQASYKEGNTNDNIFCIDVSNSKVCSPGTQLLFNLLK